MTAEIILVMCIVVPLVLVAAWQSYGHHTWPGETKPKTLKEKWRNGFGYKP